MSPHKDVKFPPLTPSHKQRLTYEHSVQNDAVQASEEGQEGAGAVSVQPSAERKLCSTGSSYIFAGVGRKPQLLLHLESHAKRELRSISPHEPKFQELKLQVYRGVFARFIKEFKTYQPLLSAIKKEYENTLAHQRDQIRNLEPLRSQLRLATEECDRKIRARWGEERAEIGALTREKRQLQRDIEAMREKDKATQAVVERLQVELSNQYLQYREERDARKLLIWQLSDLTGTSSKEEHPAEENTEAAKDSVELRLALKVCREDLTKAQEELRRMKAEYWDVVPRRDWDTLEQTHGRTLLRLKTLQGDFDQLKSEYDTLLELHNRGSLHAGTHDSTAVQMDASASQGQSEIQPGPQKQPHNSEAPEHGALTAHEFRADPRTALPPKSGGGLDELVTAVQSEADRSDDISSQSLQPPESGVAASPPALDQSEENAASNHLLQEAADMMS